MKLSQVVELSNPQKGCKANVKWGRSIFPATIMGIGNKSDLKKKEKDIHVEKDDKDDDESTPPAKKRKTIEDMKEKGKMTTEGKKEKGKKKVTILCVTELCDLDEQHGEPSPVPVQSTPPDSNESEPTLLKQLLERKQTVQMTLQSVESYFSEQFAIMQAIQDAQAAKLIELQVKLENLACTAAGPTATAGRSEECHLSPAEEVFPREILRDVTNLASAGQSVTSQLSNTPACAPSQLKSAGDVIGTNSKLLPSVTKAGRLSVKLARDSYFGEDVMCTSTTVSGLDKDKLKEIKARLYEVYRFDNLVEFEPLWQKCLIAIGKACQGLRAKATICIS